MIQYAVLFDDDEFVYLKEINNTEILNKKISISNFKDYKKNKIEV